MAGILKVDRVQSDINLAFNIAGSNVAVMDSSGLQILTSNLVVGGATIATSGKVIASAMHTGAVLQAVQSTTTTQVSVNTNTYTDIGLSASITPISISSKILVITNIQCYVPVSGNGFGIQLLRGATIIWNPTPQDSSGPYYNYSGSGGGIWGNSALMYMDTPATTSSTTYKIQGRPYSYAISAANFQHAGGVNPGGSSMILLEVA